MKQATEVILSVTDPYVKNLLEQISDGKHVLNVWPEETIFAQGNDADAIFFIQSGKVKMSVVSAAGKEAVIAMLGPHNFLGEGCLTSQAVRISTATELESSVVFRVEK